MTNRNPLSGLTDKNVSVCDICPSCGYPRDLAAFEHCSLCRKASRDENDREAKTDPFEKVQEALASSWAEFTATEDFRNRMALAQEIELLNAGV